MLGDQSHQDIHAVANQYKEIIPEKPWCAYGKYYGVVVTSADAC